MANFIPPIDLGQFQPSAAAISSWLYQIWDYLQKNPITSNQQITEEISGAVTEVVPGAVEEYMEENPVEAPVTSVNSQIGAVIITYAQLVNNMTLPIYRASNDEIDNADLLEAYAEGCRFCVVDDEACYAMLKDDNTITLLPMGGGGGGGGGSGDGIQSINTTVLPDANGNAVLTANNIPMATNDPTTVHAAVTALKNDILQTIYPVGATWITFGNDNPATKFGFGTWSEISGRMLLGYDSTNYPIIGATGGEATHTLTIDEMPTHRHQINMQSSYLTSGTNRRAPNSDYNDSHSWTEYTGGDQPHNNMPPYIVTHIWRRTA